MYRRRFLAVAGLVAVSGCSGSDSSETPTPASDGEGCECPETPRGDTAANIRVTSIGQSPVNDGAAVEVQGAVANSGSATHDTTVIIQLLDGEDVVAERRLDVGTLAPDETATFATTIEVNASAVDGRQITFD